MKRDIMLFFEKNEKRNSKIISGILVAGMLLFLLIQYQLVFLYYDDYGYQSLSYGVSLNTGDGERLTLNN